MDERLKQVLVLAREHYGRREYDRAEHFLLEVLEKTDRYADVYNMLGVILHERGDFAAAERHFERAVELNPAYTEALLNLAVTYNDLGKYEAAREVYARTPRRDAGGGLLDPYARGKIANMHADLAQAYVDAGGPEQALEELKKAVALCPHFADLQTRLGSLYKEAGDLERAREHYGVALEHNPNLVGARVLLGVTLVALGDSAGAVGEWRAALALDPDNRSAKTYLRMAEAGHLPASRRGGGAEQP